MSADFCTIGLSARRERSLRKSRTPRPRTESAKAVRSREKIDLADVRGETGPVPARGAGCNSGRCKMLPHTCYKIASKNAGSGPEVAPKVSSCCNTHVSNLET